MNKIIIIMLTIFSYSFAGLYDIDPNSKTPLNKINTFDASNASMGLTSATQTFEGNINSNPALYAGYKFLSFKFNFNSSINTEKINNISNTSTNLSNTSIGMTVPLGFVGDMFLGTSNFLANKISINDTLNNQSYLLSGAINKAYIGYSKKIKFLSLGITANKYIGNYTETYSKDFDAWTPISRDETTLNYKYKKLDNFSAGVVTSFKKFNLGGYVETPIEFQFTKESNSGSMNYSDQLIYTVTKNSTFKDSIPLNVIIGGTYKLKNASIGINGGGSIFENNPEYVGNFTYIQNSILKNSPLIASISLKKYLDKTDYRLSTGTQILLKKNSGRFDINFGVNHSTNKNDTQNKIFLNIGAVVFNQWSRL